ncbi:Potassium voltage-gated channel subfamily H member 2 [Armadillidium nasatum]|uniref:Potassium voltage-gated channel subfamily H member 2 n=1 Tax=Armadillidium nasatum TaxID=96803 RepID=A0A5N5SNS9_9CRUS|nr:Potassium voltage-gated channel subfamily H member 2 [Armadillidium nasatum]
MRDRISDPHLEYTTKFFPFLLISDIFLNFRTTFVNKKGEVILCPKQIALNYLKGWFFLDLVAAMPFDMLLVANRFDLVIGVTKNIFLRKSFN